MLHPKFHLIFFFAMLVAIPVTSFAERSVILRGRPQVWISKSTITVSDIMEMEIKPDADREAITALGNLVVGASPLPGKNRKLSGNEIVNILTNAGINFEKVGYVIPRSIMVTRAARELTEREVKQVVNRYLQKVEPDSKLERIILPLRRDIFTGDISFRTGTPEEKGANRVAFPIIVESSDKEKLSLTVDAFLARYKNIPVARRPLERGELVDENDIVMARIDLSKMPSDLVANDSQIVGMELTHPTSAGGYFRKRFLKISPTINTGSPLTIRYAKGLLTATATGTSMEEGVVGDLIRVRNDSSRKILRAKVVSPGLVEVGSQ